MLMANPRRRWEAYSAVIVVMLASIPPMPIPVTTRALARLGTDQVNAEASIPALMIARQRRIVLRRPIRSATGARNSDPAAMPNSPALSNKPTDCGSSDHSAAIDGAVKAMTSTSKPSIMLMTTQIVTASTCTGRIGPCSMLATMSVFTARPNAQKTRFSPFLACVCGC